MGNLKQFCENMRMACEDWSLGYDQYNRWAIYDGGECDCSSLVIWALKKAGFDVGSASYTGDMSYNLTKRGWKRLSFSMANVKPGDILLNDTYHVCAVISGFGSSAKIAQASIDENGAARNGKAGDQTGYETNTKTVYEYRKGWDCILRYVESDGIYIPVNTQKLDIDGEIGVFTITEWQKQLNTYQDGYITGQLKEYSKYWPNLEAIKYDSGSGSALVKAIQTKVGVPNPTGIMARGTISSIQSWLLLRGYEIGTDMAGYLGESTAKAIQVSLNKNEWV